MLFTKSFFALVAVASMVAASPAERAADATVTCTVTGTTSPHLPSFVGALIAGAIDTAVTADFPGSTVTSGSVSYNSSTGTFTFTITVNDPHVSASTLISELDGETVDTSITVGPITVSVDAAISSCHS